MGFSVLYIVCSDTVKRPYLVRIPSLTPDVLADVTCRLKEIDDVTPKVSVERDWGPFLERPGNLTGPKSYFEIKVSRKVGSVLSSNEVHFVSLADNFTAPFLKPLKLPS